MCKEDGRREKGIEAVGGGDRWETAKGGKVTCVKRRGEGNRGCWRWRQVGDGQGR